MKHARRRAAGLRGVIAHEVDRVLRDAEGLVGIGGQVNVRLFVDSEGHGVA